ncbi:MAG: methylated-DNA--[protein]-cysteine S-methyltransferase [Clostridia bacterium]|nr:methylated-DNA--[protein]-cysteine S-methyltransferase [Clostridia bacterium]
MNNVLTKVVAGILVNNEKVYLFKRKSEAFKDLYEFPGGKVEENETNQQALKRELMEELDIDVTVGRKICEKKNHEIAITAFLISSFRGTITLKEHKDFILIDQKTIRDYPLVDIDVSIAEDLFKNHVLIFSSKLGNIKITGNHINITSVSFTEEEECDSDIDILNVCKKQLKEYLHNERKYFDLPLHVEGTDFQKQIWEKTSKIEYGSTLTYSQLHKGARAAGSALSRNRHLIIIPCHRVTRKDSTGNYRGGTDRKIKLLAIERR